MNEKNNNTILYTNCATGKMYWPLNHLNQADGQKEKDALTQISKRNIKSAC